MKTTALLAILLVQSALGGTPSEALGAFKQAAKTNIFEDTWKFAAKFDGLPKEATEYFKGKVQKFIDLTGKGWDFEIIEEKVEGDCAVVVINESKKEGKKAFDLDPAYLIKQNGEWRVLPGLTDWKIAKKAAEDKVISFEKLSKWFETRSEELKKIGAPSYSAAGEHSWIIPGQCTPPELWTRGIVPTTEPKLELHDKIVFDMKGGRLVMEFEAVDSESLTVGWMWIAPEKITSGSSVFPKSSNSFVLTGTEEEALKFLKFTCSYDSREKRLLLRLGLASPRYALVHQQGEAGTGQPATRPELKPKGSDEPVMNNVGIGFRAANDRDPDSGVSRMSVDACPPSFDTIKPGESRRYTFCWTPTKDEVRKGFIIVSLPDEFKSPKPIPVVITNNAESAPRE